MMICFRLQFTHRILKKTSEASHDDLFCLQFTHTIYMYALSAKEPCKYIGYIHHYHPLV